MIALRITLWRICGSMIVVLWLVSLLAIVREDCVSYGSVLYAELLCGLSDRGNELLLNESVALIKFRTALGCAKETSQVGIYASGRSNKSLALCSTRLGLVCVQ